MLIVALIIWFILLLLAVAFCRAAASADGNMAASRYPSRAAGPLHTGVADGARAVAGQAPQRGEVGVAAGGGAGERRALGI